MAHDDDASPPAAPRIGTAYAEFQLARALAGNGSPERVRRWTDVLQSMFSGIVTPGRRRPVAGLPSWVTLEVATGGFATGKALSAGPMLPHEQALLEELGLAQAEQPRLLLNRYFLSVAGLARLDAALQSQHYAIEVAEEGALLVVAWLVRHGQAERARALVDILVPHMDELRFYPAWSDAPRRPGTLFFRETAGTTARRLQETRPNPHILAQREAIGTWAPLQDRLVALFLETVSGPPPTALKDATGSWQRGPRGSFVVEGGWPCAHYPEGWKARAAALVSELAEAKLHHGRCSKPSRPGETLAVLADAAGHILADPARLTGRNVGWIRLVLARHVTTHGLPGSDEALQRRERQSRHATAPTHEEIAQHLGSRLRQLPQHEGVDDIASLAADIGPGEVAGGALSRGARVPAQLARKLERCVRDSIEGLVRRGLVPSGEVLAEILPQFTSGLHAAGFTDEPLRVLYASVYRAFRRRRSLLLLDLQRQVQFGELPWVQAMESQRPADAIATQALAQVAVLALTSFPQAVLPNKLVRELDGLARSAALNLPLTEELAADIFMGSFSPKFAQAVTVAAPLLQHSIYARYYRIDYAELAAAAAATPVAGQGVDFMARTCAARAGVAPGSHAPAVNGRVIEQQQILTTHNLAALAGLQEVRTMLAGEGQALAMRCFDWALQTLQLPAPIHHLRLIRTKNAAYAWRQMVFFLSLSGQPADRFVQWARDRLDQQPADFRQRFAPVLHGLAVAAKCADDTAGGSAEATIFLGWADGGHGWTIQP